MKPYLAQQFTALITWAILGSLAFMPSAVYANETAEQIRDAVRSYVDKRLQGGVNRPQFKNHSSIRTKIGRVDARLRLSLCEDDKLIIEDHSGSLMSGRYLLKATCTSENSWSLYVPVSVVVMKPIVVATQVVPRGSVIQASQVELLEWEVSLLRHGYFESLEQVIGSQLSRPLTTGRPVIPDQLGKTKVVNKGDSVLIEASNSVLSVKSPGIALSSGGMGDQINVRNSRSKKIIRGTITGSGKVSVPM